MKRLASTGLMAVVLVLAGCGGGSEGSGSSSDTGSATSSAESSAAAASGCSAGGLDAMTALSDFQLEMDQAQKDGKITTEQLIRSRDKLFNETQAAQEKSDWAAYCKAIDDTRAELGI